MSMGILAAFVAACIFLAITPGPNMSLIIANTSAHGLRGGLWTLAGSTTGFSILVGIAALGMTSVMVLMADWFDVIRWLGAAYLVYLGARQLYAALYPTGTQTVRLPRSGALYVNGLVVSLSNPKVLLFLGAFLPQFVDPTQPPGAPARDPRRRIRRDAGGGRLELYAAAGAGAARVYGPAHACARRRRGRAFAGRWRAAGDFAPSLM